MVEGDAKLLVAVAHRVVGLRRNLHSTRIVVGSADRSIEDDVEPLIHARNTIAAAVLHHNVPDPRTTGGDQQRQYQDADAQTGDNQP